MKWRMVPSLFFVILMIIMSGFIISCPDNGGGGNIDSGEGGSSTSSSASLLQGAYSIDPNGSDSTSTPIDDSYGNEDPGLVWQDNDEEDGSDSLLTPEANVYRGATCFPGISVPPQIPCSSFSVCAFTMDGTPQNRGTSYQKIKTGKKLENIYINFKINYLSHSYFQHWDVDELGYQDLRSLQHYVVPIVVSGKVQYTKDIVERAPIEEDIDMIKKFDLAKGLADNNIPASAKNVMIFKDIPNQYAFTSIYTDNLLKSGILARFSQQLWRNNDVKLNKSESSVAGDIPKIKKLSLKIPLRKDPQGNWHYQEVIFRNVMVHRVLWGPEPRDFKGISGSSRVNGCYQNLPPGTQAPWNGNNFYNEQGQDAWWKTQWEVPWQ